MTRPIEIVCHRGANRLAPENTYPAAAHCIEWGVDWLEIDVNTSRDGVMYVFHGPDLERTTNGTGKIYEHDATALDALDAGGWFDPAFTGERIPRLEEFLRWVDDRVGIFFDVKWAPLDQLRETVDRHRLRDHCFFWFGREKFARELRNLDPDLTIKINVASREDIERAIAIHDAGIVEVEHEVASRALIDAARSLGVRPMIKYGGDDEDTFRRIIDMEPDMVNVDHADVFQRVMAEAAAAP